MRHCTVTCYRGMNPSFSCAASAWLVLKTVEEMGYAPDQRARSYARRILRLLAYWFLICAIRISLIWSPSMEDEFMPQGYSTLIGTTVETVERQDAFIDNLLGQRNIDGQSWCRKVSIRLVCGRLCARATTGVRGSFGIGSKFGAIRSVRPIPRCLRAGCRTCALRASSHWILCHTLSLGSSNINER